MTNDILKLALIEAIDREFGYVPSDEEIVKTHEFSKEFESKMEKLQKKSKIKYIYIFNVPVRRMVVVAACILIICTTSLSVEAIRTPIINFCITVYEKFSSIFFVSDDNIELSVPSTLEILYYPADIPDGYTLIDDINTPIIRILIYSNVDGNEIEFQQYIISTGVTIDTEGITIEEIFINMNNGIFYSTKGTNVIVWHDNQYGYIIRGTLEKTVLHSIAKSLKSEK